MFPMRNIGKIYGDAPAAPFCSGGVARFVLADPFFLRLTKKAILAPTATVELSWRLRA